jgi:hypothetical protein
MKVLWYAIMVVIQCPHCSLEVELDDGVSGLFDCPHCGEDFQWGESDEENDGGWFVPWISAVTFFGIIILTSLMYPDMFMNNSASHQGRDFGFWNFILSVIIFILLLLFGAIVTFLPNVEPE